jgi:hypothetical protein
MREVIAAPKYNPYELDKRPDGSHRPPEVVTPVGAVKLAEDLPVPLLPGAPTPGAVPWDWIRLGEPKPKEEEEK